MAAARSREDRRLDVDEWYPALAESGETMATKIIPFSFQEATAVLHLCEDVKFNGAENKVTEAEAALLNALARRIDTEIQPWIAKGHGAFIRLSKRSPKDAALRDERLLEVLEKERKKLFEHNAANMTPELEVNLAAIALTRALTVLLKITSGAMALQILSRSLNRIYPDLTLLLLQGESAFQESIVLREFQDGIRPEMEFRAFVSDGVLTALTQYNSLLYVPEIVQRKATIGDVIQRYFSNTIKPILEKTLPNRRSYVIDFALLEGDIPKVIELNPFGDCTHACLFDWKKDITQLTQGPFELRVVEGPVPNMRDRLAPELRMLINKLYPLPPEPSTAEDTHTKKTEKKEHNCVVA